ncbi:phosphoglucosamine mutase [Tindallia magadiensis]|uniref:Phosphoglucosamine mutase n=1 Tax=Tindallia magadiensis TaxID=69895 RepID=A0A1I3BCQ0_9FIRM|nr:phosphoglucosamine mutase [Tindallia magadiensis]SFH60077.1 phosphoglucosamine mutase [Tindallia magadiensis]
MARLFGTDGVRGIAGEELTPEMAYKMAKACACVMLETFHKPMVIIGKDTRRSCDMLEASLSAGFFSMGVDVAGVGIIPTPGVAYLTKSTQASCGVMISASHNPAEYNGIKFFNNEGFKLDDQLEDKIEEMMKDPIKMGTSVESKNMGKWRHKEVDVDQYVKHLKESAAGDYSSFTITIDTANGAAFRIAPEVFAALGAKVHVINDQPDGVNINKDSGSTHVKNLQKKVVETNSHFGFAYDGDADRLIAVDEKGAIVDGDKIMALLALRLKEKNKLPQNTLVTTVMSNLGLELALKEHGCKLIRTKVGDRYVIEEMKKSNFVLGGEQSGHIIYSEQSTTGDGLLTSLMLTSLLLEKKEPLSQLASVMKSYPQVLVNAKVENSKKNQYLDDPEICKEIDCLEAKMDGKGRVLIRPSGTEALVRVMLEGENQEELNSMAQGLADTIQARLG